MNLLLVTNPKEMKTVSQRNTHTTLLTSGLVTIAKIWEQPDVHQRIVTELGVVVLASSPGFHRQKQEKQLKVSLSYIVSSKLALAT